MPELIKPLVGLEKKSLVSFLSAQSMFDFAKFHVVCFRQIEYKTFVDQIYDADNNRTEHRFLREYLWCVYVSGFSAKTISKKYDRLLQLHQIETLNGEYVKISPENILTGDSLESVFDFFKNKTKGNAIQTVRAMILNETWSVFSKRIWRHATFKETNLVFSPEPKRLEVLPMIGPALSCHLARNLGNMNVCKPDVHLKRLAQKYNYDSVERLCKAVSGDDLGKVDLILWLASIDHGTT